MTIKLSDPRLPVVPQQTGQRAHDAVKEALETMRGVRGDVLDRAVFIRDLTDLGIIDVKGNKASLGTAVANPVTLTPDTGTGVPGLPPALSNIVATAGFSSVLLTWDDPHYAALAYYEVWRRTVTTTFDTANTMNVPASSLYITQPETTEMQSLGALPSRTPAQQELFSALVGLYDATANYTGSDATLVTLRNARIAVSAARANSSTGAIRVGTTVSPVYTDAVDTGTTYIYWVRAISTDGTAGPFNAVGLEVTTQPNIGKLMRELTDDINNSQIASFIFNGIDMKGYAGYSQNTTLGNSLVQQNTYINNLNAGWGVRISTAINGKKYVSGFGLNQEIINGGTSTFSTFLVAADRFAIVNPSGSSTDVAPFIVDGGKVYIDMAMIKKAAILELIAGSIVADYVRVGTGLVSTRINTSTINIGTWTQTNPNDPTTWTYNPNTGRQGNFSVDASGWMHTRYALMRGIVIYDDGGNVVLDTLNNTYQNAMVSRSNPINASNIGTFISNLAVGSLHIQGNAVTAPSAQTWAGSLTLNSSYTAIVSNMWVGINPVTGLSSVDNDIPVAIMWAAECTAQNTNAAPRRFRIRLSSVGGSNTVLYETFSGGRDTDQFNSGVVMARINAGVLYFVSLEATGSGIVYQGSLYAVVTRR